MIGPLDGDRSAGCRKGSGNAPQGFFEQVYEITGGLDGIANRKKR